MRKKIGILTYFGDLNPGTNLQAYSLFKNIKNLYRGEKCTIEIINYQSFKRINRPFLSSITPRSILNDIKRINKYQKFQQDAFIYSKPHLITNNYELAKEYIDKQEYDVIYIGSDTLLELHYADKSGVTVFWLPSDIKAKKIIIAASARDTQFSLLTDYQKRMMKDCVLNIHTIGVRDDSTERLMKELAEEKKIQRVPDPTFAFDIDYSFAEKYMRKKGISSSEKLLCIHLTREVQWGRQLANIARAKGFKVVSLRPCYYADYIFNDLGPLEHAGVFQYFTGVITHRFHDTVFSLKNKTPVITILPSLAYENELQESKHSTILQEFNLYNNYIREPNKLNANTVFLKFVRAVELFNRNEIELTLKKKRVDFINYLETTIKEC